MSVTETLNALGGWEVQLRESTPDRVTEQLGFFGHVAIADGPVDVEAVGDGLLDGARYVGVLRAKDKATGRTLSGSGMVFWLGDEDGKGDILETEVVLTAQTLAQCVTAIVGPSSAVTVGTVHATAGTYTGKHQFQTRREALSIICDAFNVEFRVNGDATVDVGTAAQLYNTEAPDTIIVRKGAGVDMDLVGLGGDYQVDESVYDYSTRVVLLGQTIGTGETPDEVFATGAADAPSVPYVNLRGNTVRQVRTISESGTTTGSVAARSQLALNRFNRTARSLKVTAEEFETEGNFVVGDSVYVYDPETGIVDTGNEVTFRGEVLHPDVVRVSGITWPVVQGMTVAFRTGAGVWLDLTPFVTWETGGNELTVGDLPKSLTKPTDNPVQVRLDAARADASVPGAPTGLGLTTSSALNSNGQTIAVVHASWTAPSLNTDGSVITDLSHYVVRYRPQFRSPQWFQAPVTAATEIDLTATPSLPYDVQVAAVDLAGHTSDFTATSTITAAADTLAPNPPADPMVTSYLGQLRIEYAGTDSSGNPMASDTNRIDVHVSATSGFTPSVATRVDSITPFAKGVSYATAPYGSPRYVKLVAVDHTGNPSAASGQVSGSTTQAGDGDIAALSVGKLTAGVMTADVTVSGRFTTALTGQRAGIDALGLFAYNASDALTIRLDGVNNLLTGKFQTALSGRRIEMGSAGAIGDLFFYAPDGSRAAIHGFTSPGSGTENIRLEVPVPGDAYNRQALVQLSTGDTAFVSADNIYATYSRGLGTGGFVIRQQMNAVAEGGTQVYRNRLFVSPSEFIVYDDEVDDRRRVEVDNAFTIYDKHGKVRQWLTDSGTNRFYADDDSVSGAFGTVFQQWTDSTRTTARDRLWLNSNGQNSHYADDSSVGHVFFLRDSAGSAGNARFWIDNTGTFLHRYTNGARAVIIDQYGGDASPGLSLIHDDNHGSVLVHVSTSSGSNRRLEVRDAGLTQYDPVWASAFTVSSSETVKGPFTELAGGALEDVRGMPIGTFRRKKAKKLRAADDQGRVTEGEELDDRVEVGTIAERAPASIAVTGDGHTPMVDLVGWTALNTAAIKELAALVDELRKGAAG